MLNKFDLSRKEKDSAEVLVVSVVSLKFSFRIPKKKLYLIVSTHIVIETAYHSRPYSAHAYSHAQPYTHLQHK